MKYRVGDIVKLDLEIQSVITPYLVACPYVRVLEAYEWEATDPYARPKGYVKAVFSNWEEGTRIDNINYFLNMKGSVLHEARS